MSSLLTTLMPYIVLGFFLASLCKIMRVYYSVLSYNNYTLHFCNSFVDGL